ncbi:hypothetical protein H4R35_004173, partial [Dimargaris xerosporica]
MFRTSALGLLVTAAILLSFNASQVSSQPARPVKAPENAISNDSPDNPFNPTRTLTITEISAIATPTDGQCVDSAGKNITDGSC